MNLSLYVLFIAPPLRVSLRLMGVQIYKLLRFIHHIVDYSLSLVIACFMLFYVTLLSLLFSPSDAFPFALLVFLPSPIYYLLIPDHLCFL